MAEHEAEVWEQRYSSGAYQPRTWTSAFLAEWLPSVPVGTALDIACGAGRNALALAAAGFETTAVDISETAVTMGQQSAAERGLSINWQVADLDGLTIEPEAFDLITCFRFRSESLWPRLAKALKPDGWLIAEHHFRTSLPVAGPPTDNFRLQPGEYLRAFRDLRIIHYSESIEEADKPGESHAIERVVAVNGDPGF
jgi:2-polyprenyl-3-methyl-5-hydroxy-6-metoxy-1,4-benzoquinol methylase